MHPRCWRVPVQALVLLLEDVHWILAGRSRGYLADADEHLVCYIDVIIIVHAWDSSRCTAAIDNLNPNLQL